MTTADATRRRNGPAELAVLAAVRSAPFLSPRGVDRAAVQEARVIARVIDQLLDPALAGQAALFAVPPPVTEIAGQVGYLSNTLLAVLGQLGLTPAGRAGIGMEDLTGDDDTLAEIRAIRSRPQTAAGDVT